jgi:hypothetical protein
MSKHTSSQQQANADIAEVKLLSFKGFGMKLSDVSMDAAM